MHSQCVKKTNSDGRPLVLYTVVWGKEFRDYLIKFFFPSLLACGNLPYDTGREKIIIIAGPPEDHEAIIKEEIFAKIRKYAAFCWLDFQPALNRQIRSMSIGHSMCLKKASEFNAYACQFPPDSIYSNKSIKKFEEFIGSGFELVLAPAIRCDEQKLFVNLGLSNKAYRKIDLSAPDMYEAILKSLHSQVLVTNVNANYFFTKAHLFHIRSNENSWFVAKNMAWAATLIDTANISDELIEELARSVIDSYILAKMFPIKSNIKFLSDRNEFCLATWAPTEWSSIETRPQLIQKFGLTKKIFNDYAARKSLQYYLLWNGKEDDWIKRFSLVNITVRIGNDALHGTEMSKAEAQLTKFLERSCKDLLQIGHFNIYLLLLDIAALIIRRLEFICYVALGKKNARNHLLRKLGFKF